MIAAPMQTNEEYVFGLTDFGPVRSKLFANSANEYLKVHQRGPTQADVTEDRAQSGSACPMTGPNNFLRRTKPRGSLVHLLICKKSTGITPSDSET